MLWLAAGLFGAHRWYVGRWFTALIYFLMLMTVMTGGFVLELMALLGVFALIDAAFIPYMVRKRNAVLETQFKERPERFIEPEGDESVAPWARHEPDNIGYILTTPLRVAAFILLPALAASLAVFLGVYELVVIPIAILLATGLIGSLDKIVTRHPTLGEIPGLDTALDRVGELRQYYWDNEPKVLQSFLHIFRKNPPYWKIILFVLFVIAIETVVSYDSIYPPYLGPSDALEDFIVLGIVVSIGVLIILVPLTTLSFRYSLSGKRHRLQALTVAALLVSMFFLFLASLHEKEDDTPSVMSGIYLESRMESPEFRENLKQKLSAFLHYYTRFETDDYTAQLRESLAGIAQGDEIEAFEIINGSTFLGVGYKAEGGPCSLHAGGSSVEGSEKSTQANQAGKESSYRMLSIADSNGRVYHVFNDQIPKTVRDEFSGIQPDSCHKLIDDHFSLVQSAP
ncbi:MAG: TM2 domain-containing protein [Xanthomonadales bacterium]|nr:TM2 domain-containing protein [Gammaproteobacteria bacterium]MBT8052333.1 TM2 domain-containing protein [Gammaproteobacteria bacterium]NND56557.1 TM2 domain-containing protein [Xanthomonadales bacterium]NNK52544.1 TM2 domain-containing protein [Xanthomonadales bacterium]